MKDILKFIFTVVFGVLTICAITATVFIGAYKFGYLPTVERPGGAAEIGFISDIRAMLDPMITFGGGVSVLLGVWLWLAIMAAIIITFIIITWRGNSLHYNIYIHIAKWLTLLLIISAPIAILVMNVIQAAEANDAFNWLVANVRIGAVNICILGALLVFYIFVRAFGKKVTSNINRALQADRTATEMRKVGRTPIVLIELYRIIDFIFPELLMMGMFMALLWGSVFVKYLGFVFAGTISFMLFNIWIKANQRRDAKWGAITAKMKQIKAEQAARAVLES